MTKHTFVVLTLQPCAFVGSVGRFNNRDDVTKPSKCVRRSIGAAARCCVVCDFSAVWTAAFPQWREACGTSCAYQLWLRVATSKVAPTMWAC